jgi:hypothetical protein
MKPWLEPVAVASALCAGAGSVCAQTVITHEIVREPVAAVIVREPVQAIITAAPVQAFVTEPVQTFVAEPALAAQRWQITRPVETMGVGSAEAIVVPPTTRAASKSRAAAKPRIVAKRRIAVRNRQAMPASVRLPAVAPLVVREAVSLTPGERSVLYRTIVGEQVVPEPIVVR